MTRRRWVLVGVVALVLLVGPLVVALIGDASQGTVSGGLRSVADVLVCVEDVDPTRFNIVVEKALALGAGQQGPVQSFLSRESTGSFSFEWLDGADQAEKDTFIRELRDLEYVASVRLDAATCADQ